jgi:hypothetical protein
MVRSHIHDLEDSKMSIVDDVKSVRSNTIGNNISTTNPEKKESSIIPIHVNPMDLNYNDAQQMEKGNWYCSFATYENGVITCNIPKIDNFNQSQPEYNVDIAINGQQFTGFPMIYRFYEITVDKMEPNISLIEGGLTIKIIGTGFFDSVAKKARISSNFGVRFSDLQWDRTDKSLSFTSHPLLWSVNDEEALKSLQSNPKDLYTNYPFDVSITMNNLDWIKVGDYRYCDFKVLRLAYVNFPEKTVSYLDVKY